MSKKLNPEDARCRLENKIGDKYDVSEYNYIDSKTKGKVICHKKDNNGDEHGVFLATFSNLMYGYGCPKCAQEQTSINMRMPYDEFQHKLNELYGENRYIVDSCTYHSKPYEFNVYCTIHKTYFSVRGREVFEYRSKLCPECQKDDVSISILKTNRDTGSAEKCEQPVMDENLLNRIKNGEEVWVPVKGYENDYMVSSNGKVKRINRLSKTGNKLSDMLMRTQIRHNGRCVRVSLKGKDKSLHKVVFESFYNMEIPKGYDYTVDHIDTNPLNNTIFNLRLCKGIRDNMLNNSLTRKHLQNRSRHRKKIIIDFADLENEIWVPCLGYEGLYSVSNKGRVKSEERTLIERNTGKTRRKKCRLLSLFNKDNKAYTVGLVDENGKHKNYYVHKLMYESFYGKVNNDVEIGHIDGNSLNNVLENLKECTHKEICAINNIKRPKHKNISGVQLALLDENNNLIKDFVSYVDAATYFNVSWHTIERYINKRRKTFKCLPDGFKLVRKEQNGVINDNID